MAPGSKSSIAVLRTLVNFMVFPRFDWMQFEAGQLEVRAAWRIESCSQTLRKHQLALGRWKMCQKEVESLRQSESTSFGHMTAYGLSANPNGSDLLS